MGNLPVSVLGQSQSVVEASSNQRPVPAHHQGAQLVPSRVPHVQGRGPLCVLKSHFATFRSWFCTEKPHSMTHWAENYETVGRIRIISTCVTESRMKTAVKTPARKTNNQASFGGSILKNNMEVEAAMELQRHLDETGVHQVHYIYA